MQLGAGAAPSSEIEALAVQPDGKVVVAGDASDASGHRQLLVARLRADGGLDSSFGGGGVVLRQLGAGAAPSSEARALALQPDGGIVAAGSASVDAAHDEVLVTRLRADGMPDADEFGTAGAVRMQLGAGVGRRPGPTRWCASPTASSPRPGWPPTAGARRP